MTRPPNDRGQGRKALPDDQKMKTRPVRMADVQWNRCQALSEKTGLTVAEHIRRAIDAYLKRNK